MTAPPAAPPSTGTLQPLDSIWNHKLLAILVALLIASGGTGIAWLKGTPIYRATAVVHVAPRFANILRDDKELEFQSYTQYQQFIEQQLRTINRYDIVLEALQRLGERRFALWQRPGETDRKAAERLQAALAIRHVRDTYLVTVALESETPNGLHEIVNQVVEVYLERTKREDIYASEDRIDILEARRRQHLERIGELIRRRSELAQTLGVTTFADDTLNPYDTLLLQSKAALIDAERQRITAEAELATYDADVGGAAAEAALQAAVGDLVAKDPGLNSLKANLYKRRSELLEQTTGLAPSHPVRRKAERELDDLEAEVARASADLAAEKAAMLLAQRRAQVRETQAIEAVLRSQLEAQQANASWFATRYNEALDLSDSIARERDQLDAIDDRIDFLDIEAKAPGYVRISTWALEPVEPVGGGRTKLAVLFAALGGALGLIIPIAVDLIDRRLLTTRQAQALLGFPPLAAFIEPSSDPAHRALSADQMRRLAIALGRRKTAGGLCRLLITAARRGGGATGLAFDLARELRRQGARVLVIEADPLAPDPRYASEPPRPGLAELLTDDLDLDAALVPGDERLPERIGTGETGEGHLGEYGRLPGLLEAACRRYDFLLIDSTPIRLSADTEYLAGICDMTLLVVRARHTLVGEVKGSAARLEKAAPPIVGLVMTGLPIFRSGGYYREIIREYAKAFRRREPPRDDSERR